ncbi:hypothetical protein DIPPA_01878 [Diplonema papillatum]|nr:hypothetical protein DIPPA_01878 [Diplonema papillatum]
MDPLGLVGLSNKSPESSGLSLNTGTTVPQKAEDVPPDMRVFLQQFDNVLQAYNRYLWEASDTRKDASIASSCESTAAGGPVPSVGHSSASGGPPVNPICSRCQASLQRRDRFCSSCGAPALPAAVPSNNASTVSQAGSLPSAIGTEAAQSPHAWSEEVHRLASGLLLQMQQQAAAPADSGAPAQPLQQQQQQQQQIPGKLNAEVMRFLMRESAQAEAERARIEREKAKLRAELEQLGLARTASDADPKDNSSTSDASIHTNVPSQARPRQPPSSLPLTGPGARTPPAARAQREGNPNVASTDAAQQQQQQQLQHTPAPVAVERSVTKLHKGGETTPSRTPRARAPQTHNRHGGGGGGERPAAAPRKPSAAGKPAGGSLARAASTGAHRRSRSAKDKHPADDPGQYASVVDLPRRNLAPRTHEGSATHCNNSGKGAVPKAGSTTSEDNEGGRKRNGSKVRKSANDNNNNNGSHAASDSGVDTTAASARSRSRSRHARRSTSFHAATQSTFEEEGSSRSASGARLRRSLSSKDRIRVSNASDPCLTSGFFLPEDIRGSASFYREPRFLNPTGYRDASVPFYFLADQVESDIKLNRSGKLGKGDRSVATRGNLHTNVTSKWGSLSHAGGGLPPGPGAYEPRWAKLSTK